MAVKVRRGDVYLADLSPTIGSEHSGIRNVMVIQNNVGNTYSPTIIVAVIFDGASKKNIPTHAKIIINEADSIKKSNVAAEQIRTIDKSRLLRKIGTLDEESIEAVNNAIRVSLGIRGE